MVEHLTCLTKKKWLNYCLKSGKNSKNTTQWMKTAFEEYLLN